MNTLMRFDSGLSSYQFEAGGEYPAKRKNKLTQVSDRTSAGTLQTENLGLEIKTREIIFKSMSLNDYQGLINWFLNVCVGKANSFLFTDEYGDAGEVVMVEDELIFDETSYQQFSGSITLEYI